MSGDYCEHGPLIPGCPACMIEAASRLGENGTGFLADVWQAGYASGHSNAMRRMSDEPNAPTTPNPYQQAEATP